MFLSSRLGYRLRPFPRQKLLERIFVVDLTAGINLLLVLTDSQVISRSSRRATLVRVGQMMFLERTGFSADQGSVVDTSLNITGSSEVASPPPKYQR